MTLADEMLEVLSDAGIALGPDGRFVNSGTDPTTDERVRFLNLEGDRRQPDTNARLKANWVRNLEEITKTLSQDGESAPWPFMAIFWLRLHGVLADLRKEHLTLFQRLSIDPFKFEAQPNSLLRHATDTFRAIDGVRSELTEDELIYIDCRRQTEAHPIQTKFDYGWSSKAKTVTDRRNVPTLGRELTVSDRDAAIKRVLHAHRSENAIAVFLARKVSSRLPPLVFLTRVGAGG